jgi:hypothetical protein
MFDQIGDENLQVQYTVNSVSSWWFSVEAIFRPIIIVAKGHVQRSMPLEYRLE